MDAEFEKGLAEIRRRRLTVWIIWAGYLPFGVVVSYAANLLGYPKHNDPWWILPVMLAYMGVFAWAGMRAFAARCPRCHERFSSRTFWRNSWTQRCLHCQLPLRPR